MDPPHTLLLRLLEKQAPRCPMTLLSLLTLGRLLVLTVVHPSQDDQGSYLQPPELRQEDLRTCCWIT